MLRMFQFTSDPFLEHTVIRFIKV